MKKPLSKGLHRSYQILLICIALQLQIRAFGTDVILDFEGNNLEGWYFNQESAWCLTNEDAANGEWAFRHCRDNDVAGMDWVSHFHDPLIPGSDSLYWQFNWRYDFSPSSNNRWVIYASGGALPNGEGLPDEGIFLGVNVVGSSDCIQIGQVIDGKPDTLIDTPFNWQDNIMQGTWITLELRLYPAGEFAAGITYSDSLSGNLGSFSVKALSPLKNFTLVSYYTATYDQGLWLDDLVISGNAIPDTDAPAIAHLSVLESSQVHVVYTEPVLFSNTATICINDVGCSQLPMGIAGEHYVDLPFDLFPGAAYELTVPELEDVYGNLREGTGAWLYYPSRNDVVISEIMADPSPPVLQPEVEFVELYNRSDQDFWIENWSFSANATTGILPPMRLNARQYYVLTSEEAVDQFPGSVNVIALPDFPTLSNSGAQLILQDASGAAIHSVRYTNSWHCNSEQGEGGYSLEMIDFDQPCIGFDNWTSSSHRSGATPGTVNSEAGIVDRPVPTLWRTAISDSGSLMLYFSEPVDSLMAASPEFYWVDQGVGFPYRVKQEWPISQKLELFFWQAFQPDTNYRLSITSDVCNCTGAAFKSAGQNRFAISHPPNSGDIRINEILYEPAEDHIEFVELYNNSELSIDLRACYLTTDPVDTGKAITLDYWPVAPGSYVVLAESWQGIDRTGWFNFPERIVLMQNMPSLRNDGSWLGIRNPEAALVDDGVYDPGFHHDLLIETQGVSLERIKQVYGEAALSWTSASADAGFMTPAQENSQLATGANGLELILSSESITPNGDGFEDQLLIQYKLDLAGYIGRVYIYDVHGYKQAVLAEGVLLGSHGIMEYGGKDTGGNVLPDGYYILYFEATHAAGSRQAVKRSFVIAK